MTTPYCASQRAVRERPILFSGPMVRAILDGTKTQTRRVVKLREFQQSETPGYDWTWRDRRGLWQDYRHARFLAECCPYGVPGDRLWVRETWAPVSPDEERRPVVECNIEYRADTGAGRAGGWDDAPDDADAIRWRPSIHMPRRASRLTLEITDVRVERVQDISTLDIRAEGMSIHNNGYTRPGEFHSGARAEFADLWDSINAKRGHGWDTNPWVWVITGRKVADA